MTNYAYNIVGAWIIYSIKKIRAERNHGNFVIYLWNYMYKLPLKFPPKIKEQFVTDVIN